MSNKFENAQLPLFSALMAYAVGDKEAEAYLKSIGHLEDDLEEE